MDAPTAVNNGAAHVLTTIQKNGTTAAAIYTDNALDVTGNIGSTNYLVNWAFNKIGAGYQNRDPFTGDIAEILIYNRTLDSSEIFNVNSYLAAEFAIPIAVPEPA